MSNVENFRPVRMTLIPTTIVALNQKLSENHPKIQYAYNRN